MDTIYTMMVNFQDVLKQHGKPYGVLWCGEGGNSINNAGRIFEEHSTRHGE